MNTRQENNYWTERYNTKDTGWDIGQPSTPLKSYINQLSTTDLSILIPGAGNAYEAEYLWENGFKNITVIDISEVPLIAFKARNPSFPAAQVVQGDFFEHQRQYDLILEQTFFCSFVPTEGNRNTYAKHAASLLKPNGKLVGVWFNFPLSKDMEKRPFGGSKSLYLQYLTPYFSPVIFEDCYNSIPPRAGKELFGIFKKREL